jgi:hypothetical protein
LSSVNVISVVPCAVIVDTPFTVIEFGLFVVVVATAGFELVQALVVAGVFVATKVTLPTAQIAGGEVGCVNTGNALTVTVTVEEQPFASVNVITVEPPDTPVTKPVLETIAIPGELLIQAVVVVEGALSAESCVVPSAHISKFPLITGLASTPNVAVAVAEHVFESVNVTV